MMSVGARSWQVVKPHIPLIKFRKGGKEPHQAANHNQSSNMQSSPATSKSISERGTAIEDTELPPKYSRKPLSQLEIETIELEVLDRLPETITMATSGLHVADPCSKANQVSPRVDGNTVIVDSEVVPSERRARIRNKPLS